MPNSQVGEPIVITKPSSSFQKLINSLKVNKWKVAPFVAGVILFLVILLNYLGIPAQQNVVAIVNNEKIYKAELEAAKGFFSNLHSKDKNDPEIKKEALDFIIDRRLLEKDAQKRGVDISSLVDKRFNASITQYGDIKKLEETLNTDSATYRAYLTSQTIKEALEPVSTQWRILDYLSIRYLWNDNAELEEQNYKKVAQRKAEEYYQRIQAGLDIKEAIRLRCRAPEINYLPFEDHHKIYLNTFDGKICREQRINFKISKETNPEWGDDWLREVFKLKKGLNPIMDFSKSGVGMFFIINVLEESQGTSFSLEDLIKNLKSESNIKIYEK